MTPIYVRSQTTSLCNDLYRNNQPIDLSFLHVTLQRTLNPTSIYFTIKALAENTQ